MVELLLYWASRINIKQGYDEVTCPFQPGLEVRRNRLPTDSGRQCEAHKMAVSTDLSFRLFNSAGCVGMAFSAC